MAIVALWVAGRVLILTPYPWLSAFANAAFPRAVATGICMPPFGSGNRRNYFFVALRSRAQRVIGYLLRDVQLLQLHGNQGEVTLPIGKGVIASRLNLTPPHFSRVLHDLTARGLITVTGRTVRIADLERLRAYD